MQIKVWSTLEELEDKADAWNNLLLKSASHVPFLRHEYLTTWWKTLGGGEWQSGSLHVIAALTGDGELTGIAPLFHTKNLDGKSALMFIGSFLTIWIFSLPLRSYQFSWMHCLIISTLSRRSIGKFWTYTISRKNH